MPGECNKMAGSTRLKGEGALSRIGRQLVSQPVSEFEEFVAKSSSALLRFAYLLTGDRALAEDLTQQAFIKSHRRWEGLVRAEQPVAYVRRAITNEFISWRRRRSSTEIIGAVPSRGQPDATEQLLARDLVWRALATLPRRQRAVLVLRYYEAAPDADIASLLGCAEGTVRSLAARAFDTLRRDPEIAHEAGPAPLNRGETL